MTVRDFLSRVVAAAAMAACFHASPARSSDAEIIYKKTAGSELRLIVEKPPRWKAGAKLPAIVFYFGGGWVSGSPNQFKPQSEYFASRGMVGVRVEYRVIPKGQPDPPIVCIQDAKSAMRYVREHADELGIDPQRIAAAGGSAGGHLAAATALLPGFNDAEDNLEISSRPDALILFNPVFDNGPGEWGHSRVGARYEEFSPAHHVDAKAPPTVVFLGEEDRLIPVKTVRNYAERMKHAGARCDTHFYPDAGHGFFNKGKHADKYFAATVAAADEFLVSLGWLKGPRNVQPTESRKQPNANRRVLPRVRPTR